MAKNKSLPWQQIRSLHKQTPLHLRVDLLKPFAGCCVRLSNRNKKGRLLKNGHDKRYDRELCYTLESIQTLHAQNDNEKFLVFF